MNNTQAKNDSQNKSNSKESLRGEAQQKHGVKGKKTKKINPETAAAREVLIGMSQEAKDMMARVQDGEVLEGFKGCIRINDFLLVMHQKATGCQQFRTFNDWKKAGYMVKKGSKSYRVWGSPLKAKIPGKEQPAPEAEGKSDDVENTFKFWPMCSLFNERQVEPFPGGEKSQEADKQEVETATVEQEARPQEAKPVEKVKLADQPEPSTPDKKTGTPSLFVTNDYEELQEARKDRMLERADKASAESQTTYGRAKDMASIIPFGQPVHVGHYSEQRDRNYRNKIHNTFKKSFDLYDKADHYREKAATVGNAGIASNDPEAIGKLKEKLARLERSQETMKTVNKIVRAGKLTDNEKRAQIVESGLLLEAEAVEILKPDTCGTIGFASFSLRNNNVARNRIKKRITELERLRNSDPIDFRNDNFSMAVDNGRVCIEFSGGKPSDDIRAMLKVSAFKWSRYQAAWVRKATANGVAEARRLLERLKAVEEIY